MDRRQFLGAGVGSTVVGVSGCLGSSEADTDSGWSPEVEAKEPHLTKGDEEEIVVEATGIQGLHISPEGETEVYMTDEEGELLEADETVVIDPHSPAPGPDAQMDSYPPIWMWESKSSVEATVSIHVLEEAEAGEYPYAVIVDEQMHSEGESERFEFSITVESE